MGKKKDKQVGDLENQLLTRFSYALETDKHFRDNIYFLALGDNHSAAKRETFLNVATQDVDSLDIRKYARNMPSLGSLPVNKSTQVWYLHHSIVTLPLFPDFTQSLKAKKPHYLLERYNFPRRVDPWVVMKTIRKVTAAHVQLSLLADVYERKPDFKNQWDAQIEKNSVHKIPYFCF